MWFYYASYLTIILSALTVVLQLAYMPLIVKRVENSRDVIMQNIRVFKILERDLTNSINSSKRSKRAVVCAPARRGPPGLPGKDGPAGADGPNGKRGLDARDILSEQEEKCVVCPAGKQGPEGPPGERGLQGEKGNKGSPGIPAVDGIDGEVGPEGDIGPPGFPGKPGARGPAGRPAEGGVGKPGPKGADGPVGRAGAQGPRGKRNYIYGPPGPPGQPGPNGLDGVNGNVGERGPKGPPGEKGADAKFCPCPMELHLISDQKRRSYPKAPMSQHSSSSALKPPAMSRNEQENEQEISASKEISISSEIDDKHLKFKLPAKPLSGHVASPPATQEAGPPAERSKSLIAGAPGTIPGTKVLRPLVTDELVKTSTKESATTSTTSTTKVLPTTANPADSSKSEDDDDEKIDFPAPFGSRLPSNQAPLNLLDEVDYEETSTATTTRRRFVYVTKKPRLYF